MIAFQCSLSGTLHWSFDSLLPSLHQLPWVRSIATHSSHTYYSLSGFTAPQLRAWCSSLLKMHLYDQTSVPIALLQNCEWWIALATVYCELVWREYILSILLHTWYAPQPWSKVVVIFSNKFPVVEPTRRVYIKPKYIFLLIDLLVYFTCLFCNTIFSCVPIHPGPCECFCGLCKWTGHELWTLL